MALYRDVGVVLRSWKLGEADRIVSIFARDSGKIRAVAKGVRKSGSRFGARLEPACHVSLQLFKGRGDLDTIIQVELISRQADMRDDFEALMRASAMLEAVDHATPDRDPNAELYEMLVKALATLASRPSPLVAPAFFLKLLSLEGLEPSVSCCVGCGAEAPLVAFDLRGGGAQCPSCRSGVSISPDALDLLQQILGGRLGHALGVAACEATHEVDVLATRLLETHLERRIRSAGLVEHH